MVKKICPNCKKQVRLNEYVKHCKYCGRIFIELMNIMSTDEIKERATTHRCGENVDRLDG